MKPKFAAINFTNNVLVGIKNGDKVCWHTQKSTYIGKTFF